MVIICSVCFFVGFHFTEKTKSTQLLTWLCNLGFLFVFFLVCFGIFRVFSGDFFTLSGRLKITRERVAGVILGGSSFDF